ncbi:hypothetical protein HPP92_003311 [Vanilla planifolia]|uniref:DYW domain-containing protein n=1 Tax=Vanilla planifolia TaxID=51239 RepID=A0A835RU63_VANPL|nr:hypothetical protein HPP92_003311 [Vanilla planifolia]
MASLEILSLPPSPTTEDFRALRRMIHRGLDSCLSMMELRQYHSQLVRLGLSSDNDSAGRLVRFCALSPSGDLHYALRLSELLPRPDPYIFNTLIRSPILSSPLFLYSQMLLRSVHPNEFTFPALLKSLSSTGTSHSLDAGRQVHAHVFKFGFHHDTISQNNLVNFYFSYALSIHAGLVFEKMLNRDVVSWTTMISGLCRIGSVSEARNLFDIMPKRSSISWNAMISGYVQNGCFHQAFELFNRMRGDGLELDKFVAASMLAACTGLSALEQGRWIHSHIERNGIELDAKLATTIVNMYCKCGCLEKAYEVFNGLRNKGLSTWNCMIGGLASHGRGEEAIKLFTDMEKEMVRPDDITLLNILNACGHTGLVDQGRYYFHYMVQSYGIEPKMEHFGCLVNLLGRAGHLQEAKKVIDEMPMEPDAGVLGALFGACSILGNLDLGDLIGTKVVELDPENSGRYILLANLYSRAGRWDDAANIRRLMNDRGVKKETGWSVIEKDGVVNKFIAGGKSHPEASHIYTKVDEMLQRIRLAGYVLDTEGMLHEMDDKEDKKNPLRFHSEKLAIAFGLLHSKPGDTLRITKNLRMCSDCHAASKLIAKVYDREIVMRDRNRFHHFKGGKCSCKDYW